VQRLLLDSCPGVVLGPDLDGRIRWFNPAGAERLGYGREELSGRALGQHADSARGVGLDQPAARCSSSAGLEFAEPGGR